MTVLMDMFSRDIVASTKVKGLPVSQENLRTYTYIYME